MCSCHVRGGRKEGRNESEPAVVLTSVLAGAVVEQGYGDAELARTLPHLAFVVVLKRGEIQFRIRLDTIDTYLKFNSLLPLGLKRMFFSVLLGRSSQQWQSVVQYVTPFDGDGGGGAVAP